MPTLFESLRPLTLWLTDEQLVRMIEKGVLIKERDLTLNDVNAIVNPGESMKIGNTVWTVYDFGSIGRKSLPTAEDNKTEVVCPTCNGTGVINEPT